MQPLATTGDYERLAEVFKALGHPARLCMAEALRDGERCVCELQALVGSDMSTVSRHLSALKAAGVVSARREGANMFYRLEMNCVPGFLHCLRTLKESAR